MRYIFLVDSAGRFNLIPASRIKLYELRGWRRFMSIRYPSPAHFSGSAIIYNWAVRRYGF